MRYRTVALAAFLGLLSLSAHAAAPLRHAFNVAPGGTLYVDADIGSVHVNPGARGVDVTVERDGSESELRHLKVTFDQIGNDAHITLRYDRSMQWFWFGNSPDVRVIINVPAQYNADLKTSGADVVVGDLHGRVNAATSGGSVTLAHIDGAVEAHTSGGSIRYESARTALLKTSGGSIRGGDVAGHLEARTSGGSITVGTVGGPIDAHTSGGSIRVALGRQPGGDSHLSTSGGSITIALANNVGVYLDAHTSGGGVETDVPVEMLGHQEEGRIAGKIHGGGPRLELRTSGGHIRVRPL